MLNNFHKTAVVKKYELSTNATQQRILLTNFGGHYCAQISPDACFRFSIIIISTCKYINVFSFSQEMLVGRKRNFYRHMYRKFYL